MKTENNNTVCVSGLNDLARQLHERAKAKGFWDEKREIGTLLMLIVSELSEALEADRKGSYAKIDDPESIIDGRTIRQDLDLSINDKVEFENIFRNQVKDTFEDELADVAIRLFDLVGEMGIDIEKHMLLKMEYNSTRPYKHGKAY